jgi:hypothetical protein
VWESYTVYCRKSTVRSVQFFTRFVSFIRKAVSIVDDIDRHFNWYRKN